MTKTLVLSDYLASVSKGVGKFWLQPVAKLEPVEQSRFLQQHVAEIPWAHFTPWPGDLVCGEGRDLGKDEGGGMKDEREIRAAIFIGPEFGTVQRADLVAAAREAGDAAFDVLIACAFNYEAHTTEFTTLNNDTSRPFEKPKSGRIAMKVINHLGDEVMKVFKV